MNLKSPLVILAGGLILIGLVLMSTYNGLVTKGQQVDAQWAQVETQYQRRFDLIPNLVETVKGYFKQEQDVFGQIAEARTRYSGAATPSEKAQAATGVESALGRLLVIIENYPDLKSNQTVLGLMDELAGTENRVSVERKKYNDLVRDYNTTVKKFPTMFIAQLFGFGDKAYFEAAEAAEAAPTVKFSE